MKLDEINVYRMCHIENIPHILQHGITHKNSPNANQEYVSIGDVSLINTRDKKVVLVDNGKSGNPQAKQITLGNYTPFYFGVKMPMLLVMKAGSNFVEKATPAEQIIYLKCSLISIVNCGTEYYFSDGSAIGKLTTFYDSDKINQLPKIIDWAAVRNSYWGGNENLNLKRKKQAEFLVANDVPVNFIVGFGCYNDTAKEKLIEYGVDEEKIKVIPNSYY